MKNDTIAAIATALSDSGIGMIRISGKDALTVGDRVFRAPGGKQILEKAESHTIHYGYIIDTGKVEQGDWKKDIIDEVMVSVMRAPRSFTMEDTVEISCHGGILVMRKILEIVCCNGARMAEPGEFTKRAFLNGRIDLSRAEAVIDVIHSQNEFALHSSMSQLQGNLFRQIKKLREEILYEIAFIESALDDPEHISLDGYPERLLEKVEKFRQEIGALISTADNGRLMKEGINTVILGKPNVGKSSLMNLLVGEERAIVTEIAGTTRDILRESVRLQGISLNVVDTAGIRDTQDMVEKIGVEKAKKYAEEADLVLFVVDGSAEADEIDREIFSLIKEKKMIILLNKSDLVPMTDEDKLLKMMGMDKFPENISVVRISLKENTGIEEFERAIKDLFFKGMITSNSEIVITNLRHKAALQEAFDSLGLVRESIGNGMAEDFYSIDLMSAYASLGYIIGEQVDDNLVDEIFSKFCMGK